MSDHTQALLEDGVEALQLLLAHTPDTDLISVALTRLTDTSWGPGLTLTTASRDGAHTLAARLGLPTPRETAAGTQVHTDGVWGALPVHIAGVLAPHETPAGVSDPADADRHDTTAWKEARDLA